MQVTETLNDGLKRALRVVIAKSDLEGRCNARLEEIKSRASIKGFRPGKVPGTYLKKVYGKSAMAEVMQDAINDTVARTLTERDERAAAQPKIDLPEDQSAINKVLDGEADLAFIVSYEVLPAVTLMDFSALALDRPIVETTEALVDKELKRLFRQRRGYEDKGADAAVAEGDSLGLAFVGRIDGETFEGGSSDHAHLVVGGGDFIRGFEEQLVGMKKGETRAVDVTFPPDYAEVELRGKAAVFEATVLHIDTPEPGALDDDFAKKLGLDDLAALREALRGQVETAHKGMSRQAMKRQVLDALDDGHKFAVPQQLVDAEFETIWQRVVHEIEHHGRTFADEGTTEDEARGQYNKIAERRVRLGLVVAEIGNKNKIEVTEEEHQQALVAEIRRYPGQEQKVYDYFRNTPAALVGLRAPIFENKVVDFLLELASVTDKAMTREELRAIIEDEGDDVPDEHHHH